jgi:galactose mutarotase-like enzyme
MAYEEKACAGQIVDVLSHGDLQITVARLGAELISLRKGGAGFLYRDGDLSAPASGWKNHATVMGYYVHRLKNESTLYRGEEIRGGTHSFLRHKTFPAPKVTAEALTYTLTEADIAAEEYPLPVNFQITYRLSGDMLMVEFRLENQAPDLEAHVSFGLHPGFACGAMEQGEVLFLAGRYRRHLAPDNFLSGQTEELDLPAGPMPFSKKDLPESFLLEPVGVAPVLCFVDQASGRRVELDFSQAPYFTLWSDGGPFLCVEPCWGLPDHHEQRPFEKKLGIQVIPPKGVLEKSFSMRPLLS